MFRDQPFTQLVSHFFRPHSAALFVSYLNPTVWQWRNCQRRLPEQAFKDLIEWAWDAIQAESATADAFKSAQFSCSCR